MRRPLGRIGLVVHPRRDIDNPLGIVRSWAEEHEIEVVQIELPDRQQRGIGPPGRAEDCQVIVAIGGDGTTLAAMRVAAAAERPVLGIACGSLGALTTVPADGVLESLERFRTGDWRAMRPPTLDVALDGGDRLLAFNDVALLRRGGGQLLTHVRVDGALYARFAGDGCIISTAVGSSAYTLAARGPLLAPGLDGYVLTPLSVHGGFVPPIVVPRTARLELELEPGHDGGRLELDGQLTDAWADRVTIRLGDHGASIIAFSDTENFLTGLRQRGIIADSPRIVAEDARAQAC